MPDKSPLEDLAAQTDPLTDDELAERLASHADRDLLLEVARRSGVIKGKPAPAPRSTDT